jgi:hypothetical protein
LCKALKDKFCNTACGPEEGSYIPVVGTLTVDLVANTAQFSGDMGKASQDAENFGKTAAAAGEQVDFSMREAKGSMMLLGEEIGVHIPRHLQALIAEIPGVGIAFAEMLPIVGVVAAIAIIAKLIEKNEEAKEKLAQGWDKFGTVSQGVFNTLGDKMLEVGKKADELAGRHLAALQKELTLIDHASLRELAEEFGKLEKAGESLMTEMKSSWYEIRMGSQGAQNALTRFTGEYDLLLAKGDKKGAFDKLQGTLNSANAELAKMVAQENTMYAPSQKMVDAQRLLVSILEDQLRVTKEVADITTGEKSNAKATEAKDEKKSLDERNEEAKEFYDKALKAQGEYNKERAKAAAKAAQMMIEIGYAENKGVEEAWKESVKRQEELAQEANKQRTAIDKLNQAATEENARHYLPTRQATAAEALSIELAASQNREKNDIDSLNRDIAQLAQFGDKEAVQIKQLEDKKTQVVLQANLERTKITDQALEKQYQDTARFNNEMASDISKTLTKSILESQNMAVAFKKMGAQMVESMMETAMKSILLNKQGQLSDAEAAASAAYKTAIQGYPSPFNMVVAPMQAAAAFAGAMQFAEGGEVPGVGSGDTVPAMLTPGETVVTKALTDQVRGNTGGGGSHMTYAPTIHAVDGDGVERMLKKHSAVFHAELKSTLRKHGLKG